MRLHETRLVDRPQEEVFEYTADFANIEQWDPGVASSRRLDEGPVGMGSRYELMVRFGTSTIPMLYEITEYLPSERVVLVGRGETVDAVDEIRFEAREGQTLVDYTADLTFHNSVKYIAPLLSPMFKRVGERAVNGLVEALRR